MSTKHNVALPFTGHRLDVWVHHSADAPSGRFLPYLSPAAIFPAYLLSLALSVFLRSPQKHPQITHTLAGSWFLSSRTLRLIKSSTHWQAPSGGL